MTPPVPQFPFLIFVQSLSSVPSHLLADILIVLCTRDFQQIIKKFKLNVKQLLKNCGQHTENHATVCTLFRHHICQYRVQDRVRGCVSPVLAGTVHVTIYKRIPYGVRSYHMPKAGNRNYFSKIFPNLMFLCIFNLENKQENVLLKILTLIDKLQIIITFVSQKVLFLLATTHQREPLHSSPFLLSAICFNSMMSFQTSGNQNSMQHLTW